MLSRRSISLSVAGLKRVRNGAFKARKALPEDVRDAYAGLYGQRWEAIFWAPAGTHPDRVKLLHVEWLVEVERRVLALRSGEQSESAGSLQGAVRSPAHQGPTTSAERPRSSERARDDGLEGPAATSATDLFEAYCTDKAPAASTINRWRAVFTALDHVENWQAPAWDGQAWLDGLKTDDRSPRTVRDVWLSAARTVCRWAMRKKRLASNPFEGCTVEVPKTIETRETGRAFTEAEATTILQAAAAVTVLPLGRRGWQWSACRRWVPWIAAYTGARAGELTQLRAGDVEQRPCGVVIKITPEAGTVKTGKVRVVPLHPDIGPQVYALARTVEAAYGPTSPVFHTLPKADSPPGYRGPAIKTRERLAAWVRAAGITDTHVSPNHAWRHTFKRRAARAGIEANIRDGMCGHSFRTVADMYEAPSVEDLAGGDGEVSSLALRTVDAMVTLGLALARVRRPEIQPGRVPR